jgi:hypothetical protein
MSFGDDIRKFADKTKAREDQVLRGTTLDLTSAIVQRTPVGNPGLWASTPAKGYTGGMARANWFVGVNRASAETTDKTDKPGNSTINAIRVDLQRADRKDTVYVTNALPYIGALENGHSTQAPAGMVSVVVTMFRRLLAKRAKR